LAFGNDILTGKTRGAPYKGVSALAYRPEKPPPNWNHLLRHALFRLFKAIRTQTGSFPKTVAILVSNNRSALKMSNALNALGTNVGKPVRHKLLFDEAESLLSARLAAFLLEPKDLADLEDDVATSMEMIAAARRATGQARTEVAKLQEQAIKIRNGKALNINIAKSLRSLITELSQSEFTGDPAEDWLTIKQLLRTTGQDRTRSRRQSAGLPGRFPKRTPHLGRPGNGVAARWAYTNARAALDQALAQEQILDGVEAPSGVAGDELPQGQGEAVRRRDHCSRGA
jgi:DNA helicase-2/ATP-dependent DNA helicase PcrA